MSKNWNPELSNTLLYGKMLINNTLIAIISYIKVGKHKLKSKLITNTMYHIIRNSKPPYVWPCFIVLIIGSICRFWAYKPYCGRYINNIRTDYWRWKFCDDSKFVILLKKFRHVELGHEGRNCVGPMDSIHSTIDSLWLTLFESSTHISDLAIR